MKEFLVILLVIGVLFALTAIRYRKQIAAAIRIWGMLKQARAGMQPAAASENIDSGRRDTALVNCGKCGNWVPETKAMKISPVTFLCLEKCARAGVAQN